MFKNLKIRTKTLIIVLLLLGGIGAAVIYGLFTLSQLQENFVRLDAAKRELTLSRGMDRQTHRVWVMVLKLSNIKTTLEKVFDAEALKQQTTETSEAAVLQEEVDKALASAVAAQQDFELLLVELEDGVKEQDSLGANVENTKEFLVRFKKESALHDEAVANVIEANARGVGSEELTDLIFRGTALGSSVINMLIEFNADLQQDAQKLERSFNAGINNLTITIWGVLIVNLLFMVVIVLFVMNIVKAISKTRNVAIEVAKGNMDVEIDTSGKDEIAELAKAIDKIRASLKVVLEEYEKKLK